MLRMDSPLFCARCAAALVEGRGSFYVVEITAYADPSGPVDDRPEPDEGEVTRQLDALLQQLKDVTPREAMDQVHRRLTMHLCLRCYRQWIENPAGG